MTKKEDTDTDGNILE